MIPSPVGFQCPECVAEGMRRTRTRELPYGGRRSANPNAFAALRKIEHAFLAYISVLFQNQALHAELHAFGIVSAMGDVWPLAALVVYRRDTIAFAFDKIHLRDQAKAIGRQGDRARMNALAFFCLPRFRELAARAIHTPMNVTPIYCVGRFGPFSLYPL